MARDVLWPCVIAMFGFAAGVQFMNIVLLCFGGAK